MTAIRAVLLAGVLFGFWLLLSGHYQPWLVWSGAALSVAVVAFALAKNIVDREGFPVGQAARALVYWPWLLVQIVKSALGVARIILDPKLPISPRLVRVETLQRTPVGLTVYANSITLTPGTISIEVSEARRFIWVHAITREGADGFDDDPMNRMVAWMDRAAP